MKYTDEQLREILMDNDYPTTVESMIDNVISQLKSLDPKAQEMFDNWIKTGMVEDYEINGITPEFMRNKFHAKDVAIILAYDGLLKNPKNATLLKRPRIKHIG